MDIRVLQYFLALAREQTISGAARALHITQPPLSKQLKELEDELGKQLFIRGKRHITLTADGMLLRRRAEEIVRLMEKTRAEVAASDEMIGGDITIGAGETEGMRLIARLAGDLQREYPDIHLHIISGDRVDIAEQLDEGLIDFALLVGAEDTHKYDYISLPKRDTWGVLMPKDHPLAAKSAVTPADLRDKPLLLSRQIRDGSAVLAWLGCNLADLNLVGTHNLIYNASLMVEEGLGLSITLLGLINTGGDSPLCYRPLSPALDVELRLSWKRYQTLTPAAELFLKRLRLLCQKTGAPS